MCYPIAAAIVGAFASLPSARGQGTNAVLNQLWKQGVPIGQNKRLLPQLTMPDGKTEAEQKQIVLGVLRLNQGMQVDYDKFCRKEPPGAYMLDIDERFARMINPALPNLPGHNVDLWFVV